MSTDADQTQELSFANHIIGDWDSAIDQFFHAIDRKRISSNLTVEQVWTALDLGYGDAVADNWADWADMGGEL